MSVDKIVEILGEHREVMESYVLLREIKLYLDVGHDHFHPRIRIKVYKSSVLPTAPYHFEVSHNVHTPEQAGPYFPSRTSAESEEEAISQAISTTTSFLKSAIRMGHEPSDSWLVQNMEF
jgi:hypothetical protein